MNDQRPAIVFLHGFALDGRMWGPQVDAFGGSYRVAAPNLPGFGAAARPSDESWARAVAEICDSLSIADAHFVGLSFGGAVAVDFAQTFPARVRSLTLVDALLRGRAPGIAASEHCVSHAKAGRIREAAACWLGDPLFAAARKRADSFARLQEIAADYDGGHWSGRIAGRFEVADPASRLEAIKVPTLVVVGSEDLATFRAMADEYAAKIPGARKVVLDGVGHMSSWEDPATFNATLRDFLAALA
jgi:pimeloyl-ACP methyl ester carboxylesterase